MSFIFIFLFSVFSLIKWGVILNKSSFCIGVLSFLLNILHTSGVELFDFDDDIFDFELPLVEWSLSSLELLFSNLLFLNSISLNVIFSQQSLKVRLSSPFSSFIELIPMILFLFFGLRGFNNFGWSVTRAFFLSETFFKLVKISFVLLGRPKKSSGNIFFEGLL